MEKKIGRYISLFMAITMSATMSIVGSFLGSVFFSYIVPKLAGSPMDRPIISVIITWLGSFAVSLVVATILAFAIGFIVPMKKINDSIETKMGKKGFVTHLVQSIVSDLIYTTVIALAMAFVMAPLFSVPAQKKGIEAAIAGIEAEKAGVEAEFDVALNNNEKDKVMELTGKIQGLEGAIAEQQGKLAKVSIVPVALKSFAESYPIEFVIALIIIMIAEPIIQKKAFKKYIPNFGQGVAGDEDI